jgi:hypothetical protein
MKKRRRRCKHCQGLYKPDSRNLKRQKFCDNPECKVASKKYSQQKWLIQPKNRDHFSGPENVIRVQQWREQNPGYWKRKKPKKATSLIEGALQDIIDVTDQGVVKLVPDVLKKLMNKKKGDQDGQTIFFPGTV